MSGSLSHPVANEATTTLILGVEQGKKIPELKKLCGLLLSLSGKKLTKRPKKKPRGPPASGVSAKVSALKGRQLASEFTGNKIKRFRRQMRAQGGYGGFPTIVREEIHGKKIIIDGHHRARAAGAAGIMEVPVEIIELPSDVAMKFFNQATQAAERLGPSF